MISFEVLCLVLLSLSFSLAAVGTSLKTSLKRSRSDTSLKPSLKRSRSDTSLKRFRSESSLSKRSRRSQRRSSESSLNIRPVQFRYFDKTVAAATFPEWLLFKYLRGEDVDFLKEDVKGHTIDAVGYVPDVVKCLLGVDSFIGDEMQDFLRKTQTNPSLVTQVKDTRAATVLQIGAAEFDGTSPLLIRRSPPKSQTCDGTALEFRQPKLHTAVSFMIECCRRYNVKALKCPKEQLQSKELLQSEEIRFVGGLRPQFLITNAEDKHHTITKLYLGQRIHFAYRGNIKKLEEALNDLGFVVRNLDKYSEATAIAILTESFENIPGYDDVSMQVVTPDGKSTHLQNLVPGLLDNTLKLEKDKNEDYKQYQKERTPFEPVAVLGNMGTLVKTAAGDKYQQTLTKQVPIYYPSNGKLKQVCTIGGMTEKNIAHLIQAIKSLEGNTFDALKLHGVLNTHFSPKDLHCYPKDREDDDDCNPFREAGPTLRCAGSSDDRLFLWLLAIPHVLPGFVVHYDETSNIFYFAPGTLKAMSSTKSPKWLKLVEHLQKTADDKLTPPFPTDSTRTRVGSLSSLSSET